MRLALVKLADEGLLYTDVVLSEPIQLIGQPGDVSGSHVERISAEEPPQLWYPLAQAPDASGACWPLIAEGKLSPDKVVVEHK
jgi:hypothetical protein